MENDRKQLVDRLKKANNVLVTVSRNPSVDQLSALLGLGLFLNKQGKHCAAVFSGKIPSTLEFLKPEATIQKNTDSLRDFIIALDKNKADKLRYKLEDNIVRIFITPYKNSINQDDLEFSQGDFNVDLVVALGVGDQTDLDDAITAHGRILHDATIAGVNVDPNSHLGSINWNDPNASSLCELVTELAQDIDGNSLDEQIATALLTGIVATTDRFSNDKTSAQTMNTSSLLMAAGANQQLVATKLEQTSAQSLPEQQPADSGSSASSESDGTLEIDHQDDELDLDSKSEAAQSQPENVELPEPHEEPAKPEPVAQPTPPSAGISGGSKLVTEPPTLGGTLTANSGQTDIEPVTDPLSMAQEEAPQLLNRKPLQPAPTQPTVTPPVDNTQPSIPSSQYTPPPTSWTPPTPPQEPPKTPDSNPPFNINNGETLTQLEQAVNSPHLNDDLGGMTAADAAREQINRALSSDTSYLDRPTPDQAINAKPLGPELHPDDQADNQTPPPEVPPPFFNPQPPIGQ